ncbi:MAG: hypothetical protein V1900_00920 [Candidatus Aenigmatarchaeota archaeon]
MVAIFLLIKIVLLVVGIFSQLIPIELTHRQIRSDSLFLNPWMQSDAGAYLDIAKNGYNPNFNEGMGNYAWYPLYPLMIKAIGFLGYDIAAFLISNIFSFLAVTMLYLLVKKEMNGKMAYKTVFYLLLFPTAYFFTAAYTESLFLFLSLACFWFAQEGKYMHSGIAGFFASLTRSQGVILLLPILYIYLREKKFRISPNVLFILLIPLGILTIMAYHYFSIGDAFMMFKAQQGFARELALPWVAFINTFYMGITSKTFGGTIYYFFDIAVAAAFIALSLLSLRHIKKEYGIYSVLSLILPISTSLLFGIPRFVLVLFPAFMMVAKLSEGKYKMHINLIYTVFIVLFILFTVRHGNEDLYINTFNLNPK